MRHNFIQSRINALNRRRSFTYGIFSTLHLNFEGSWRVSNRFTECGPVISFSPLDGRSSSATGSRDTAQHKTRTSGQAEQPATLIAKCRYGHFPDGMPVPVALTRPERTVVSWIGFFLPLDRFLSFSSSFLFSLDIVAGTISCNQSDAANGKVMCTQRFVHWTQLNPSNILRMLTNAHLFIANVFSVSIKWNHFSSHIGLIRRYTSLSQESRSNGNMMLSLSLCIEAKRTTQTGCLPARTRCVTLGAFQQETDDIASHRPIFVVYSYLKTVLSNVLKCWYRSVINL